jgi:hypothetical protein
MDKISDLKRNFESDDSYVVYYSNAQITMDRENWNEVELFGFITEQMSYPAISIPDELDLISETLERYMQLEFDSDDENLQIISGNGFSSVIFDCLVGKEFISLKNTNGLLARTFVANSLNRSRFETVLNYHPCGSDYAANALEFAPLYQLKIKPQLLK